MTQQRSHRRSSITPDAVTSVPYVGVVSNESAVVSVDRWTSVIQIARGILARLPGGRFTQSVALVAGSTLVAQLIGIATAPILTRLYSPEEFGVLGVYASLLTMFAVTATLRYEAAIPLPKHDEDGAALAALGFGILPVLTILVAVLVSCLQDEIAVWVNSPRIRPYLWLLPVGLLFAGAYQLANYWAVRKRAYKRISRTRLSQAIGAALVMACLFPFGAVGLIIGQIVSSAAGITTLVLPAIRDDSSAFRSMTRQRLLAVARRYQRFPQIVVFTDVINVLAISLPVLFFTSLFGPLVAGQFVLVSRIVKWPMNLLGNSLAQVYFGDAAGMLWRQPHRLRSLFLKTSVGLAAAGGALAAGLALFGPWLFALAFGDAWITAGYYARWLGVMIAFQLVGAPLSQTLNLLERQLWRLGMNILRTGLVVAAFLLSNYLAFSDLTTVALYSVVMAGCYAATWFLNLCAIQSHIAHNPTAAS